MARKSWKTRYIEHLSSPYWKALKAKVITRRGRRCEGCGSSEKPLDLHHEHYQTFPRERQMDVRLLCRDCHKAADIIRARRGRYERLWCVLAGDIPGDLTDADYKFMDDFQKEAAMKAATP
jgi:5-methylcytosine-specific restriction endonuclease McrA